MKTKIINWFKNLLSFNDNASRVETVKEKQEDEKLRVERIKNLYNERMEDAKKNYEEELKRAIVYVEKAETEFAPLNTFARKFSRGMRFTFMGVEYLVNSVFIGNTLINNDIFDFYFYSGHSGVNNLDDVIKKNIKDSDWKVKYYSPRYDFIQPYISCLYMDSNKELKYHEFSSKDFDLIPSGIDDIKEPKQLTVFNEE